MENFYGDKLKWKIIIEINLSGKLLQRLIKMENYYRDELK